MDGATSRLSRHQVSQEGNELCAGMAGGSFAQDFSTGCIERRIKRECAMAIVFKAVAFCTPRRKGQNPIQSIECLDGSFFVHAEDGGMGRRLQVKPNNIGGLLLKVRVVAAHIAPHSVRLQPGLGPHPSDARLARAQRRRQFATAPVGGVGSSMQCPVNDARLQLFAARRGRPSLMAAPKTTQTLRPKAIPPKPHRVDAALQRATHFANSLACGQAKNYSCSPAFFRSDLSTTRQHLQFSPLRRTKHNGCHAKP
jgi:hypothetical protein